MKDDVKIIRFGGWHGTVERNEEEILRSNFQESLGVDHWLGEGVYFFTEGVGSPLTHARNWAKSVAHEKRSTKFAVLKASIAVNDDAILDMRQDLGIELFNTHKSFVLREIRRIHKDWKVRNAKYRDGKVFEHMKHILRLEVIIMNMYVRFLLDRIEQIPSRVPNCTFLCVSNPEESINRDATKVVERGYI